MLIGVYYFGWKILLLLLKIKIDLVLERRGDKFWRKKRNQSKKREKDKTQIDPKDLMN